MKIFKKSTPIIFLLLFILSGCAARTPVSWQHPDGLDVHQRAGAQRECREIAVREARHQSFFYYDPCFPFHHPFYYHDGYYASRFFWHEQQRQIKYQDDVSRFYRVCMEAKGWRLMPDPPATP